MKRELLELLICPACLPDEVPPALSEKESHGGDVVEGSLRCGRCGGLYPIENGVAELVPPGPASPDGSASRYDAPAALSAYLWSHYADIFKDPEASAAYGQWAGEFSASSGVALDAGCATGRFTFEMARKFDFAVGIDRSRPFISTARELLRTGRLTFLVREEGRICSEREIILRWRPINLEFIVADAHALPFRSGAFAGVASLNILDKVARPLAHLVEVSRVARARDSQLLVSDPFSWSEEISPPEEWLGGTLDGRFSGPALDNIADLLSETGSQFWPPWEIVRRGSVWWKIRNHANHFELVRSVFIKAERKTEDGKQMKEDGEAGADDKGWRGRRDYS